MQSWGDVNFWLTDSDAKQQEVLPPTGAPLDLL
jgi:hypothetical protein